VRTVATATSGGVDDRLPSSPDQETSRQPKSGRISLVAEASEHEGSSADDRAIGQRLLEPLFSLVRHGRAAQEQPVELRQPLEVLEPGVRHLRAVQVQFFELREPFKVQQPGVGDLCVIEVQFFELREPLEWTS
jgi:hypothetical protein